MPPDVINLAFQISADLKGVQTGLRTFEGSVQTSFAKVSGLAAGLGRELVGALGIGFGVGSLVSFGKAVVDAAGQLQDLEDQTGISAQLLSGMKSLLEETGSSAEAFAKGIFTAQRNLGQINSETDAAAVAIKTLGLNLNELRNASPQRFLELLADALSKQTNESNKAALGSAVLGRQFRELAPALAQAAGRLEELKAAGMKPGDIKRLDEFGDSITRLKNEIIILTSGPLGALANGIAALKNSLRGEGVQGFEALESSVKSLSETVARSMGVDLGKVAIMTKEQLDALAKSALPAEKAVIDSLVKARAALNAFLGKNSLGTGPAEVAKPKTPFVAPPDLSAQKKAAEELKRIMEDAAKATADGIDDAQKKAESAGQEMIEVFKALKKEGLTPAEQGLFEVNQQFDAMKAKLIDAGTATGQSLDPFIVQLEELRKKALLAVDPLEKLRKEWEAMRDQQVGDMFSQDSAEFLNVDEGVAKELERIKKDAESGFGFNDAERLIRGGAQGISDSLRSVAFGTQTIGEAFSNMGISAVAAIQNVIFELLVLEPLIKGLKASFDGKSGGGDNGFVGAIGGFIGGLLGGTFDNGGVVPGPIGEPRLAKVHAGETILPTHKSRMGGFGGGVTNNYTIDARGAQRGVSDDIKRALDMTYRHSVRDSVAAVKDERKRSSDMARTFGR